MMSLSIISGIAWCTCEGESSGHVCDKLKVVPLIFFFFGGGGTEWGLGEEMHEIEYEYVFLNLVCTV